MFNRKPKKKVTNKSTKPSIAENLENQFGPLNEWSETHTGPKRWSGSGLTEYEQQKINEGPAYEDDGGKKKKLVSEKETETAAKKEALVDKPAEEA